MSACKWVSSTEPRVLSNRHREGCDGECAGCLPCSEPHRAVCRRAHADGTCAECVAEARDNLHAVATMCGALPPETIQRGVQSEAAMLWGPSADPEQRQHVEASYLAGRLPEGWIEAAHGKECPLLTHDACTGCAGGELHPMIVLGAWDAVWRDALEHSEPTGRLTIAEAVDYLDRQMTYMAGYEHVPFEDFARDLRACRTHLESVLHDQAQGDRANIGCFECGRDLERKLTERNGFEDVWTCRGCRRIYTYAEYNFALRAALEGAS